MNIRQINGYEVDKTASKALLSTYLNELLVSKLTIRMNKRSGEKPICVSNIYSN